MSGARASPPPRSPRLPRLRKWLFKARGPEVGEVCLVQRRVFIFPTRYGFFFAFSLLAFLAASINYDLALGFVLTFFLGSAGLVGMLHTFRNQVHLRLKPLKAEPAFAGGAAIFEVMLENRRDDERAALWLATPDDSTVIDLPPRAVEVAALTQPARQYASALGDFRRAVKNDPTNTEAQDWIKQIITIYDSINRSYPQEGEEPPPLPMQKPAR